MLFNAVYLGVGSAKAARALNRNELSDGNDGGDPDQVGAPQPGAVRAVASRLQRLDVHSESQRQRREAQERTPPHP